MISNLPFQFWHITSILQIKKYIYLYFFPLFEKIYIYTEHILLSIPTLKGEKHVKRVSQVIYKESELSKSTEQTLSKKNGQHCQVLLCSFCSIIIFRKFSFFCLFLGLHPWHMEVPRLGVQSELQPLAYATATAMQDPSASATYTTAHCNARSLTH